MENSRQSIWRRILAHMRWQLDFRKILDEECLAKIEKTIAEGESRHTGQVRFVAEYAFNLFEILDEKSAREKASEIFAGLGIWDTEDNDGVLLYCLFAERKIEILADRGISKKVPRTTWEEICGEIGQSFSQGDFETGAIHALERINKILIEHFPSDGSGPNELDNRPVVMR